MRGGTEPPQPATISPYTICVYTRNPHKIWHMEQSKQIHASSAWLAQSVERETLKKGSSQGCGFDPHVRLTVKISFVFFFFLAPNHQSRQAIYAVKTDYATQSELELDDKRPFTCISMLLL